MLRTSPYASRIFTTNPIFGVIKLVTGWINGSVEAGIVTGRDSSSKESSNQVESEMTYVVVPSGVAVTMICGSL